MGVPHFEYSFNSAIAYDRIVHNLLVSLLLVPRQRINVASHASGDQSLLLQLAVEPRAALCVFAGHFDDALGVEHLFDQGSRVPEVVNVAAIKLVEEGVVMRQDQRLEVASLELLASAALEPPQQRSEARSGLSCQSQF